MNDIPKGWDMLQLNIFLYVIGLVVGELMGELACRSIQKQDKDVKLLYYNNHICDISNINEFLKVAVLVTRSFRGLLI